MTDSTERTPEQRRIEIARLEAEVAKLIAETAKINREFSYYPIIVGAAIFAASAAFVKLFL